MLLLLTLPTTHIIPSLLPCFLHSNASREGTIRFCKHSTEGTNRLAVTLYICFIGKLDANISRKERWAGNGEFVVKKNAGVELSNSKFR